MSQEKVSQYQNIPLGKTVASPQTYSPESLARIERATPISSVPHFGVDIWNAYEVYWLNKYGAPQTSILQITYDCNSRYIIESKSLKLYLNALFTSKFESSSDLIDLIQRDLSALIENPVEISWHANNAALYQSSIPDFPCIDDTISHSFPFEKLYFKTNMITETIYTHAFRSVCPVTSQPDFATLVLSYSGKQIEYQSLFDFVVSFYKHQSFHEDCIDTLFKFLVQTNAFTTLTIQGLFTRRGGIDINPLRSTDRHYTIQKIRPARQ